MLLWVRDMNLALIVAITLPYIWINRVPIICASYDVALPQRELVADVVVSCCSTSALGHM
jgi:hypothetical protein